MMRRRRRLAGEKRSRQTIYPITPSGIQNGMMSVRRPGMGTGASGAAGATGVNQEGALGGNGTIFPLPSTQTRELNGSEAGAATGGVNGMELNFGTQLVFMLL